MADRALHRARRLPAERSGTTGHMFQAFDIGQFTDLEAFCAAVRSNAHRIRTSPPKAGVQRVYAPGDIENEKAKQHTGEGVPLEQFTLDDLAWVAEFVGVDDHLVGAGAVNLHARDEQHLGHLAVDPCLARAEVRVPLTKHDARLRDAGVDESGRETEGKEARP